MKELAESITKTIAEFADNFVLNVEKGNKAAGVRARKASLKLEKLLKEYRKESVKA